MTGSVFKKEYILFLILGCFFVSNAIIAEFIGIKIFSVEKTLGFEPLRLSILGFQNLSINMSAGIINWPLVFILTDLVNEYYGRRGVRILTFISMFFIAYAFLIVMLAIKVEPASIWTSDELDLNKSFSFIFGQSTWNISASLSAFAISQLIDVIIFHRIKQLTGERFLWLRATGSTIISQFIDSITVTFIMFYFNPNFAWSIPQVLAIAMVGYLYKFLVSILSTPLIYIGHYAMDAYLGKDLSMNLKKQAMENK